METYTCGKERAAAFMPEIGLRVTQRQKGAPTYSQKYDDTGHHSQQSAIGWLIFACAIFRIEKCNIQ
eukprot:scaffold143524_cov20-Tisochrysis_lutea.AAC.1